MEMSKNSLAFHLPMSQSHRIYSLKATFVFITKFPSSFSFLLFLAASLLSTHTRSFSHIHLAFSQKSLQYFYQPENIVQLQAGRQTDRQIQILTMDVEREMKENKKSESNIILKFPVNIIHCDGTQYSRAYQIRFSSSTADALIECFFFSIEQSCQYNNVFYK